MRLAKQITVIILTALMFVLFDLSVWRLFTVRYKNYNSAQMKAQSAEVDRLLPFDESSEIVKLDGSVKLSGELPVVDGAAAILPTYSAFVHAVYPEDSVKFKNGSFTADSAMQYTNTRGAYKSLAEGRADVIFCAKPSQEQLEYAEQQGRELELVPIGKEAFVFLVNANNPVDSLTTEQIKGIYSGRYTNWAQLGGNDRPIDAVQRNKGSGSQTAMEAFMDGTPMKRNIFCLGGSAIGYSFRYYSQSLAANNGVKMLAINGVTPDKQHISDGSYPVTGELYAVYDKNNTNKNIPLLINWILSEEGQTIVEQSGYVRIK